MYRIATLFLILVSVILAPLSPTYATQAPQTTEASGEGITRAEALNDALRNAIDSALGTTIEETTLVENFEVIRQQLASHSKGYVKTYKILSESTTDQGTIRITLQAEVDNQALEDSHAAMATLMQMAAHPSVLIAPIQNDFDALSPNRVDFTPLTTRLETLFKDDFSFVVKDRQSLAQKGSSSYRSIKRRDVIKQARKNDIDYLIFLELIKENRGLYRLQLDALGLKTDRKIGQQTITLNMDQWTRTAQNTPDAVIIEAGDHIHPAASQIAQDLITRLQKTVLDEGREYQLRFSGFQPETLKFLPDDLATLGGYVRHDVGVSEKKRLGLSYWSALDSHTLYGEVKALLKRLDAPHTARLSAQTLTFTYDDPIFE